MLRREWRELQRTRLITSEWQTFVEGAQSIGPASAPLRIVEFVSYTCPYCREGQPVLDSLLRVHPNSRIAIRQLPPRLEPRSRAASRAALCASTEEFARLHAFLLTDEEWRRTDDWLTTLRRAGMSDPARLVTCQASVATEKLIARDSVLASRLRMRMTPAFAMPSGAFQVGLTTLDAVDRALRGR